MLKKFMLKNYKNFKDEISIEFDNIAGYQFSADCVTDGVISKMLIYGRNATGKTNLGKALMDITSTMFRGATFRNDGVFLNADSKEKSATFSYLFEFDGVELLYKYNRYSSLELQDEELVIDGISIFKCNFVTGEYNFDNLKYIQAETAVTERYLQSLNVDEQAEEVLEPQLPFLRWLIGNVALNNESILIRLSNYVQRMSRIAVSAMLMHRPSRFNQQFFESLENEQRLQDFEAFLNTMGIECQLELKQLPDGDRELYFKHDKLVPFYENASSGTLAIVDLYRRLIYRGWDPSFIYLDEFDAFYHYEMAENVIRFFKKRYPKCQIVMTSHNTNLMTNRLMRPDCMFILSGAGTLTALCDATNRELREGHNLEKMYISGEFEKYE